MTDQLPSALLELWRDVDAGVAPVDDLLQHGRRIRARKRRVALAATAAVIPLVVGTGVVVQHLLHQGATQPPPTTEVAVGQTRQVGFGDVIVSVPEGWVTQQPVCVSTTDPYVFFTSNAIYNCPNLPGDPTVVFNLASVQLGSLADTKVDMVSLPYHGDQFGLEVSHGEMECQQGVCEEVFAADGVAVIVRAPQIEAEELITSIGGSIRPIPEGRASVPFIEPGTPVAEGQAALQSAGFEVATTPGEPTSLVLAVHPDPGSVLQEGTRVTLEVSLD